MEHIPSRSVRSFALLSGLLLPLSAFAQTGTIKGKVVNADSKKPVAEVVVSASSPALPQGRIGVTDPAGQYSLTELPPGEYTVRFESPRYRVYSRSGIVVRPGASPTFNVLLVPEGLQGEEVVVTGTRIPRVQVETAAPVTVVGREEIQSSGRASIGEILQRLPEQSDGINTQFNNSGDGSVRINLRGLGTARTLVLLNGRRVVAGGTGADASVDMNTIPTQAIQRVEVLKDGASAVYGSNAVSGVVNVITRNNFSGTEVAGFLGTSQRGDASILDLGFSTGQVSDRGNIFFSTGFLGQQEAWAGDRDHSFYALGYDFRSRQINTSGSVTTPNGRISAATSATDPGNQLWKDLKAQYPTARFFYCDKPAGADQCLGYWVPFDDSGVTDAGGHTYNFQPENYLATPMRRLNLFSTGTLRLGGGVDGFFEASYTNRQSAQKLAPEPLSASGESVIVSKDNLYNPFGKNFASLNRRLIEFGNRDFSQDLDTFRLVTGVNSGWELGDKKWTWDAYVNYGRTQGVETKRGLLHRSRLAAAVGPSTVDPATGEPRCAGPTGTPLPKDQCVPLNLFGGEGTITPDMVAPLTYTGTRRGFNQQLIGAANVTGELATVGTARSPMAIALGVEQRREAGAAIPDPLTNKGDTTGNKEQETKGSYIANEGYVELSLPLLARVGADASAPGNLLELTAAGRVVRFTTFGTNLTYKFGTRISPVRDLAVRGTYSTAFRAPAINELFLGTQDSFPPVEDPCSAEEPGENRFQGDPIDASCDAQEVPDDHYDPRVQINAPEGGDPNLRPETANIFTVGVVIQPRWIRNLTLTVDYYNIRIRNRIDDIGAPVILNLCYPTGDVAPQLCDRIIRNPDTHEIIRINNPTSNVGDDRIAGVDFVLDYERDTPVGRVGLGAGVAYLAFFNRTIGASHLVQARNTYDLEAVLPDWKGNLGVRWGLDPFNANVLLRWINGFRECEDNACAVQDPDSAPPLSRRVTPYATIDLALGYKLPRASGLNTTITLGVNNLLDTTPALIYSGFLAQSDAATYDYLGRYFFVRAAHSFN
jgi:iron complex outermembrane receptor protein